ncbi:uncharacterized protein B0H18DRAFT_1127535 [Fomitopsis serialis]|uniref:uncharacterized protein n=1 Tax=Fomitopsis serialis TaxID=139415 RepID=UPI00200816B8|nr:uncharacterized protein B0H18DRAFT_1127535 [Neoantrodia serialis]KAH9912168.1 hypothetical protein B0H18DRAFT_1127535 [Neoantrodia serialis]
MVSTSKSTALSTQLMQLTNEEQRALAALLSTIDNLNPVLQGLSQHLESSTGGAASDSVLERPPSLPLDWASDVCSSTMVAGGLNLEPFTSGPGKDNFGISELQSNKEQAVAEIWRRELKDVKKGPKKRTFQGWCSKGVKFARVAGGGSIYFLVLIALQGLRKPFGDCNGHLAEAVGNMLVTDR